MSAACAVLADQTYSARKWRFVCCQIMRFAWRNLYDICRLCLSLSERPFTTINNFRPAHFFIKPAYA